MDVIRKYQRGILIAVTVFVLLSFSVTGTIYTMIGRFTAAPRKPAHITLEDGRRVELTLEDHYWAQVISRLMEVDPAISMVQLFPRDETVDHEDSGGRLQVLAMLRRIAVERGLQVPEADVQATKKRGWELFLKQGMTPKMFALQLQLAGEPEYDAYLREAMRISLLVRLDLLATDLSQDALLEYARKQRKTTTLSYVVFPAAPLEDAMKATPPSDEELTKWIQGLPEAEQRAYRDRNHVALEALGMTLAKFDPADWAEESKDYKEPSDAELQNRYNVDRENFYRKPEPATKPHKEGGGNVLFPQVDATNTGAQSQASRPDSLPASRPQSGPGSQPDSQPASQPNPEDRYLKLEEVKEDIKKRLRMEAALGVLLGKLRDKAKADGEKFSLKGWLAEEEKTKVRKGLFFFEIPEPRKSEDLLAIHPELGKWPSNYEVTFSATAPDLCGRAHMTESGALIYRVTKIEKEPLKAMADIRKQATEDRLKKLSMEEAKKKADAFAEALTKAAEQKAPEEVAKIRTEQDKEATDRFTKWETETKGRLATKKEELNQNITERAKRGIQAEVKRLEEELVAAAADKKKEDTRKAVEAEFKPKLKEVTDKHVASVLEQVAKAQDLTVKKLGPIQKDEAQRFNLKDKYPDVTDQFLVQSGHLYQSVKDGAISDPQQDLTNRSYVVVRVDERAIPPADAITRPQFLEARRQFQEEVLNGTVRQAFSFKALKLRYKYEEPQGPTGDS
jgi:hypothetical protein